MVRWPGLQHEALMRPVAAVVVERPLVRLDHRHAQLHRLAKVRVRVEVRVRVRARVRAWARAEVSRRRAPHVTTLRMCLLCLGEEFLEARNRLGLWQTVG